MGSPSSSNSNRLREVAALGGAEAYRIESVADVDEHWLVGKRTIGVTAGASTPEHLVQELVRWLNDRGGTSVRNLDAVREDMFFHLPSDLAKDLEASGRAVQLLEASGRSLRPR